MMMSSTHSFYRNLLFCLVLILSLPAMTQGTDQLYFYDPDAGVNARSLKAAMKTFWDNANINVNFQPFLEYRIMAKEMQRNPPVSVVAPVVYADELQELIPLLIPEQEGQFTYTKVLVTLPDIATFADLKDKTIAATSKQFLNVLQRTIELPIEHIRFIPVKKDLDALLALQVSKQVDAVVVKATELEQFFNVHKDAAERLQVLYEFEIGLPILWAYEGTESTPAVTKLVDALLTMHTLPEGQAALQLLKYDAWHRFIDEHRVLLH